MFNTKKQQNKSFLYYWRPSICRDKFKVRIEPIMLALIKINQTINYTYVCICITERNID